MRITAHASSPVVWQPQLDRILAQTHGMGWQEIVVAGLSGGVAGGVASLIAPWSNWGVEKRRDDRKHKRDLVSDWRAMVADCEPGGLNRQYLTDARYHLLRPYLSQDELKVLERSPKEITIIKDAVRGPAGNADLNRIDKAVTRLEKAWGLA